MHRQVTFRGLSPVASVIDEVHKQSAKLDARAPQLETCHVVVEANGRPGARTHAACCVTVRLWTAERSGGMLCAKVNADHVGDLRPAVHRAFEALRRQVLPRKHPRKARTRTQERVAAA